MLKFTPFILCIIILSFIPAQKDKTERIDYRGKASDLLYAIVMQQSTWALKELPITVTASISPRSAGGNHDFFSEGDYWWPNPIHPDSPYVQKDGLTNPDNFVDHRRAMVRFSRIMGALASAYILKPNPQWAHHALKHARAWFVDTQTFMNPHLIYAQAIKGRFTGRGIGIIDTIHLMEVVRALMVFENEHVLSTKDLEPIRKWFRIYLEWLTTHPYGISEMNAQNNHGTCWTMQVACFAQFIGDRKLMNLCIERFKAIHLPGQMAVDGSFHKELARTKPYGYSLFNLDAMAMICQILSDEKENLWKYATANGQSIFHALLFMLPYVTDKSKWPYPKDVMHWDEWPIAHPFMLFGAKAFDKLELWKNWEKYNHNPENEEVLRNLPIRNPLIWF